MLIKSQYYYFTPKRTKNNVIVTDTGIFVPLRIEIKRMREIDIQKEKFIKARAGCAKGTPAKRKCLWLPQVYWHSGLLGLGTGLPLTEGRNSRKFSRKEVGISGNWIATHFLIL